LFPLKFASDKNRWILSFLNDLLFENLSVLSPGGKQLSPHSCGAFSAYLQHTIGL